MKKEKTRYVVGIGSIILCLGIGLLGVWLHFFPIHKPLTPTEIYNNALYSVVELKACSADVGESFGTGEIMYADGTLITNAHVVTYTRAGETKVFEEIFIRFAYEEDYRTATLIKYDSELDIAVLKIDDLQGAQIKPITVGNSASLKAGQTVYAIGNAANCGISIFSGMVSVPLLNIENGGTVKSAIQCDLTIAAGSSGGALFNGKGELVGITTFRTKDTNGNVVYGVAYAIPIKDVINYLAK